MRNKGENAVDAPETAALAPRKKYLENKPKNTQSGKYDKLYFFKTAMKKLRRKSVTHYTL